MSFVEEISLSGLCELHGTETAVRSYVVIVRLLGLFDRYGSNKRKSYSKSSMFHTKNLAFKFSRDGRNFFPLFYEVINFKLTFGKSRLLFIKRSFHLIYIYWCRNLGAVFSLPYYFFYFHFQFVNAVEEMEQAVLVPHSLQDMSLSNNGLDSAVPSGNGVV